MTNNKRVLILGGTAEAAALANKIEEIPGVDAIASFAGRIKEHIYSEFWRSPITSNEQAIFDLSQVTQLKFF
jgi:precorrin-6x reductase